MSVAVSIAATASAGTGAGAVDALLALFSSDVLQASAARSSSSGRRVTELRMVLKGGGVPRVKRDEYKLMRTFNERECSASAVGIRASRR
jgi:hypothetical protein